ncbi:MAG: ferrochelatase, partial [Chloroflexi bacterium]|nr:ferrochelatase [Chloroflexota bacterium]
ADHLETLYDVDVAGREQASQAGIDRFVRVEAPNAAPDFIEALASVVRGELAAWDSSPARVAWLRA